EKAQREEEERLWFVRQEEERNRKEEENRNASVAEADLPVNNEPGMETEAIRLQREKQERLSREKQNKNIRAQYESNLLKLVAESERRNNISKFNKMKQISEGISVVEVMRSEAVRKAQQHFLTEQLKERQKQTLANKQVREQRLMMLIETTALIEREYKSNSLRPAVSAIALNYTPSPHIVITNADGIFMNVKSTIITWPGGTRVIFREKEYWWGKRYYYKDEAEIDAKTYNGELYRHKRS
ncbi:MAG TPA: hypothetical protein VI731_11885, partial [Bacteroidia bacterium]|nr:hypothetical protein [Bacteroidia bacterium]